MKKHTAQPKPFQNRLRIACFCALFSDSAAQRETDWNQPHYLYILSPDFEILRFDYFEDGPVLGCCQWLTYRFKPSDKNASWSDNKAWAPLQSASNFPAESQACRSCQERGGAAHTHALSLGQRCVCNLSTPPPPTKWSQEIALRKCLLTFLAFVLCGCWLELKDSALHQAHSLSEERLWGIYIYIFFLSPQLVPYD